MVHYLPSGLVLSINFLKNFPFAPLGLRTNLQIAIFPADCPHQRIVTISPIIRTALIMLSAELIAK